MQLAMKRITAAPRLLLLVATTACLCFCISPAHAQENAQFQIPPSLVECYNTSYFMNRDNRLPATINTLISLIERVENSYMFNMDIRSLAVGLLHRFRQDGIQKARGIYDAPGVIPFSPVGTQFTKFRILLTRLIPSTNQAFPNDTLTMQERCSLHFMLSSSIDTSVRGDEGQVCNQLSQYRAQRLGRDIRKENLDDDVEMLDIETTKKRGAGGKLGKTVRRQSSGAYSEYDDYGTVDASVSQCPVENGVMWTPWGTVSAGVVIAGIAAGLQPQNVQLRTLLALSRRPGAQSMPQTTTINIDNRWAATLAGDLAEVTLVQVPQTPNANSATVGAGGAWNSTVLAQWYFLSQRQNLEMTDAEIRGGLDGLILAMNVANWRTQASSLRLSQLLRMYYSMNGVLGSGIMACNRKEQFPLVAPIATMQVQVNGFAQVLDREMQLPWTLDATSIQTFSNVAVGALNSYVTQYLNDVSCPVSNIGNQDTSEIITPMTNIYVFLDTSWQYNNIVQYVLYILQNLNINLFASTVTMLAAADGSVIVNTTNIMADVFANWNITTHATFVPGFSLPTILRTVQNLTQALMLAEQTNNTVGGASMVALLIPNAGIMNDADSSYANTQLQYLYEQVPDLKFIYYGGGTINRFNSFVRNPAQDLFTLNTGMPIATSSGPVVMRIRKIPRRIINPRCGSNWYTSTWGSNQMFQYLTPGHINFYRMVPNYFFGEGTGRFVNVIAQNSMQFTVCTSRSTVLPMQNSTINTDQTCTQISGNQFSYDLSNACSGHSTISQCPPLYLSVQGPSASGTPGNSQTVSCQDPACQSPDQARFTISVVNMGCYNGVSGLYASFVTIFLAYVLRGLFQ